MAHRHASRRRSGDSVIVVDLIADRTGVTAFDRLHCAGLKEPAMLWPAMGRCAGAVQARTTISPLPIDPAG